MDLLQIREEFGDSVAEAIAAVKQFEREKALRKYGEDALRPGGRPEFDILDFVINESVGLDRYGEMMQHRFADDNELELLGTALRDFSEKIAPRLVAARQRLLRQGENLGAIEEDRFQLPDNSQ